MLFIYPDDGPYTVPFHAELFCPPKASAPILVTLLGITTDVNLFQ